MMDLTKEDGVLEWVKCLFPTDTVQSVTPLQGGSANFIWRVIIHAPIQVQLPFGLSNQHQPCNSPKPMSFTQTVSVIVKHAEGFVASNPSMKLYQSRIQDEVAAMTFASDKTISLLNPCPVLGQDHSLHATYTVKCPRILHFDDINSVFILQDAGLYSINLKAFMSSYPSVTVKADSNVPIDPIYTHFSPTSTQFHEVVGSGLGKFIARLHNTGRSLTQPELHKFINQPALALSNEILYARFETVLNSLGIASDLVTDGIDAVKWASKILLDGDAYQHASLCMGDFWPGNIIVDISSNHEPNSSDSHLQSEHVAIGLSIVDWELARVGPTPMDLGQFLAEAYSIHIYRCPVPVLVLSFQKAYLATLESRVFGCEDVKLCLIHMGVHLIVWGTCTGWFDAKDVTESRRLAMLGLGLVANAWNSNWKAIKESEFGELLNPFCTAAAQ
ncbi:hypothetical protein MT418_007614 [Batrachochytrium dendrobatidis]